MRDIILASGEECRYSMEAAKDVIVGYCWGENDLTLAPPQGYDSWDAPKKRRVRLWGYQTYDCVEPGGSPRLEEVDLLVAAGLSAELDVSRLAALRAMAGEVSDSLQSIKKDVTFWGLSQDETVGIPPENTAAWNIHRAWWLLMSAKGIGSTIAHKVLHHKRPDVFPLLDVETRKVLPKEAMWRAIHQDLDTFEKEFVELEQWFADEAATRGGRSLTRLRLHDILLWCGVTSGNRARANDKGQQLRKGHTAGG